MATNTPPTGKILFTRQRHEALKMGLHWDYRLVHGDKAYSWATKKELPEPGKSIILFEQPVHDSAYALSKKVEIPAGEYGGGTTYLDWVRKADVVNEENGEKLVLVVNTPGQEGKFLLKKLKDNKFGDKAWLFRNLTGIEKKAMSNKYLEKIAKIMIKPSHDNELHERLRVHKGKKIPTSKIEADKKSAEARGDSAEVKRDTFALNARKWKK